ncbi:MAG: ribokinase [Lentisphaerae bacterium]|nr:ribokinase [Lentisphaerota bacterium]MCP4103351.1 ribokinase [Lentisphaerota bacterium]
MKNIVVVGSSNTDMIIKTPRIPRPGETILGGVFSTVQGGKGANQAVAAARSGGQVSFVASVGLDSFGEQAINSYKEDGIDTQFIVRDMNEPSGVALIFVSECSENSIAVAPGANSKLSAEHIQSAKKSIENSDIMLLQLEIPLHTVIEAAQLAKKAGAKVILNPAPARALPDELLQDVAFLTPNETEAELLTGIKVDGAMSASQAADILMNKGVRNVIITMGSKGVFLANRAVSRMIPAYKVDAVDTTAAGDTFNGAFAVGISKGLDLVEAIRFGSAAAAISVTKLGAQPSIPHLDEIERFFLRNNTN